MYHNKIFLIPLFFTLLISFLGYAQTRDTLIIKFNDAYPEMRKLKSFAYKPLSSIKDSIFSYYYNVEVTTKDESIDVRLNHGIDSPKEIEYFGNRYTNPITKIVNKDYLKGKRILDISYFRNTPYEEIEAFFTGKKKKKPFLFLYEVSNEKDGKITLREVGMMKYFKM